MNDEEKPKTRRPAAKECLVLRKLVSFEDGQKVVHYPGEKIKLPNAEFEAHLKAGVVTLP